MRFHYGILLVSFGAKIFKAIDNPMPVIALFVPEVSAGESMALLRMSRNAMQYRWRWEMQVFSPCYLLCFILLILIIAEV